MEVNAEANIDSGEFTGNNSLTWNQISSSFNLPDARQKKPSDFKFFNLLNRASQPGDTKVWLAKRKIDNQPCAIKVKQKQKCLVEGTTDDLLNELDLLKWLKHQYIVSIQSAFINNDYLFMEMEFAPHQTLAHLTKEYKMMSPFIARFYISQLIVVLDFLHSQKIVLRGLTPSSVLLDHKGYIKLSNFSSAVYTPEDICTKKNLCAFAYTAPELILDKTHSYSVDWWSLGVIMYEMIYGTLPFDLDPYEHEDSIENYDKNVVEEIIQGDIRYPSVGDKTERFLCPNSFLRILLSREPTDQMTSMIEIKKEYLFEGFDWDELENRKIPAPFLPNKVKIPWKTSRPPHFLYNNREKDSKEYAQEYTDWKFPETENLEYKEDVFSNYFYLK
ncbi:kinase-like domain-containing protein [Phakopsora pachyrhizi]|uniref:Kinase-like domain-containing protein n=1 Tax=Phakopsora pachyrhizi TaxID=170000 RepID=A0AAV0AF84_PHAPC|nr:kinase-like domain-containing protein [Phakopsora pachyrhizi]